METGKMKLALSAGALALSMALVGCGGGGSSSTTRATTPATPTPTAPATPTAQETTPSTPIERAEAAAQNAVAGIDAMSTPEDVMAAARLIAAFEAQIDALALADRAEHQVTLTTLNEALDEEDRLAAIAAIEAATTHAGADVVDISATAQAITDAEAAIAELPAGDRGCKSDMAIVSG